MTPRLRPYPWAGVIVSLLWIALGACGALLHQPEFFDGYLVGFGLNGLIFLNMVWVSPMNARRPE